MGQIGSWDVTECGSLDAMGCDPLGYKLRILTVVCVVENKALLKKKKTGHSFSNNVPGTLFMKGTGLL